MGHTISLPPPPPTRPHSVLRWEVLAATLLVVAFGVVEPISMRPPAVSRPPIPHPPVVLAPLAPTEPGIAKFPPPPIPDTAPAPDTAVAAAPRRFDPQETARLLQVLFIAIAPGKQPLGM